MKNNEIKYCADYDSLYNIRYVENDTTSLPHWHGSFELYFFIKGKGKHILNDAESLFSEGDIYLLSPYDVHNVVIDDDVQVSALKINFSNAFYFYYLNPNCRFDKFPVFATLSSKDFEKAKFISKVLAEESTEEDSPIKDELCLGMMEQLMILLFRNTRQTSTEKGDDKLKAALTYIQNNFHNPIKISDIAKSVSYSPNYLSSQFSKKLGISIRDYLQDLRLLYARDLIKFSNFSISEICYRSGFQSMAYFSKAFKNKFGISPNSFRANL